MGLGDSHARHDLSDTESSTKVGGGTTTVGHVHRGSATGDQAACGIGNPGEQLRGGASSAGSSATAVLVSTVPLGVTNCGSLCATQCRVQGYC